MAVADPALSFAGPAALAALVRAGEVKPRELVELFLERIEEHQPKLNAFRVVLGEQAVAEADRLEAVDGTLAGVPVAVKDDLPVAGQAVTKGSRSYGPPQREDSEVVRRLRAAGAIPIGITNVPELTIWPWTASEANGITRNPWDVARTPGGSSGGSDGGGSIRIPAACCGLVGMKPTRGRVPAEREGWLGLSVYGGLARSVKDSALLLDVMSDTQQFVSAAEGADPGQLRIAVSRKIPPGLIAPVSADQRHAWEQTSELLTELGHQVVERDPPYRLASLEFVQTWTRGIYEDSLTVPDRSQLERSSRGMAGFGRAVVSDRRRERLLAKRTATEARMLALWDEVDVLMTPALSQTAIAAEGGFRKPAPIAFNVAGRFTPWTPAFNVTGQPGVTVPAGMGSDRLPLGVQLVGRLGGEATLYALAAQLEAARPWADRRPRIS
jgi:amidase